MGIVSGNREKTDPQNTESWQFACPECGTPYIHEVAACTECGRTPIEPIDLVIESTHGDS